MRIARSCDRLVASFDPRPCARGDLRVLVLGQRRELVSIHAPARGATRVMHGAASTDAGVSIHAPARGATADRADSVVPRRMFRSTPLREGRRWRVERSIDDARSVSIHAPARGATACCRVAMAALSCFDPRPCARGDRDRGGMTDGHKCFDPRPCARGDLAAARECQLAMQFRSTPLREGRPRGAIGCSSVTRSFDPRPCARGDASPCTDSRRDDRVSIHAPARGATMAHRACVTARDRFDPRPCARGDRQSCNRFCSFEESAAPARTPVYSATTRQSGRSDLAQISLPLPSLAQSAEGPWFQGALGVRARYELLRGFKR